MQTTSNQLGAETLKSHPEIAARVEAVCPDEGRLLKRGAAAGVGGSPDLRRHAPPGPGSEGAADRPPAAGRPRRRPGRAELGGKAVSRPVRKLDAGVRGVVCGPQ